MVVPSHFVPLAAPGMVALGLQVDVESREPVLRQAARDRAISVGWALQVLARRQRGACRRAAPLLRDLHLASRDCFEELAARWSNDFGSDERGLLMLCRTEHGLEEETAGGRARAPSSAFPPRC